MRRSTPKKKQRVFDGVSNFKNSLFGGFITLQAGGARICNAMHQRAPAAPATIRPFMSSFPIEFESAKPSQLTASPNASQ